MGSSAPRAVRKTVTVVFADVVESTPLGERLDPESLRHVMGRWHAAMRAVLERHGGTVEKFVGDAVMAVFGVPVAHEDDALRAVRAADEMRTALAALNGELEPELGLRIKARTALNTGEVIAGGGETLVTGDAVHVAKRLEESARAGEILLGDQTSRLVREHAQLEPVQPLDLKGKAEPVPAWRLLGVLPEGARVSLRAASPFVGRTRELEALRAVFDRCVAAEGCELVTVVAPPGIGKSRLLREFVATVVDEARVLEARCLAYGDGITYWPLVEIVKQLGRDDARVVVEEVMGPEDDAGLVADLVAGAIGASDRGGSTDDSHWAVRRLLEAAARDRPLVLILEDLHWAEPTFLDLVEYVAGFSSGRAIMLVASARPELLEARPAWPQRFETTTLLFLEPLPPGDVELLVDNLLEGRPLAGDVRTRVLEAAGGNPLFVEQMLAFQAEVPTGGEAVMPPTLKALLTARIDRLEPRERAVMERASVAGRAFHRSAVAELLAPEERSDVGATLLALARKELVRPAPSDFPDDDGFRFVHILVRDSAYDSIPKAVRAELHERYADWFVAKVGARIGEYEELVGYHLEQAFRYRAELAPADERARRLGSVAADHLAGAAARSHRRGDVPAAANLLERACALLPAASTGRLDLLLELAKVLVDHDDRRRKAVLEDALEHALRAGNKHIEWRARIERFSTGPLDWEEEGRRTAFEAMAVFEKLNDHVGLCYAWRLLGRVEGHSGRIAAQERALRRAVEHARQAAAAREERDVLTELAWVMAQGTSSLHDVIDALERLLAAARAEGRRGDEASALNQLAVAVAATGGVERAKSLLAAARAIIDDLPGRTGFVENLWNLGHVETIAANWAAAEACFQEVCELLESAENPWLANAALDLAHALCAQGRYDEAVRAVAVTEANAAPDNVFAQFRSRAASAKALSARGGIAEAVRLAEGAVELAETTDHLDGRAATLMDLAEVLGRAGRSDDAVAAIRKAVALCERRANNVAAARARETMETVVGSTSIA